MPSCAGSARRLHKRIAAHGACARGPQKGIEGVAEKLSGRFPRIGVRGERPKNAHLLLGTAKISGLGGA